ncbi:MAG: hypothetical protein ABF916_08580 [Acetobacter fabarum]|uniref:hypothetical protein n=1 Tax=Acetobacter fabarum TaxID=483199 RepID=UPI0039E8A7FE
MDLLIATNTVAQEQADKAPASGTPGWATDGNPATGQMATDAPAWHYNMMMSELINIVKAAGITPSNSDWSQVLKAMQTIFSPAQYGVAPYSAQLAQLVGGYPTGAVVFDAAGNYWRSTQDSNLSVPGADGAKWVNFFTGILTKQQADLLYLSLLGGNVTGAMDWGSKTVANTVTHRFWSAGPPAEGDAAPDATLSIAGGTPGTANKGTMALSTGVFDLSETGQVLVPSILTFGGKDALNALTAEGRYVKSVPVSPNKRITDIWENADGRLVFGDGTTAPILASLSDLPLDPGQQIQTFVVSGDNSGIVTTKFPVAFKAGTVPRVLLRINNEPNSNAWTRVAHIALDANYNEVIDNTGFTWAATYFTSNSAGNSAVQFTLTVMAIGERQ